MQRSLGAKTSHTCHADVPAEHRVKSASPNAEPVGLGFIGDRVRPRNRWGGSSALRDRHRRTIPVAFRSHHEIELDRRRLAQQNQCVVDAMTSFASYCGQRKTSLRSFLGMVCSQLHSRCDPRKWKIWSARLEQVLYAHRPRGDAVGIWRFKSHKRRASSRNRRTESANSKKKLSNDCGIHTINNALVALLGLRTPCALAQLWPNSSGIGAETKLCVLQLCSDKVKCYNFTQIKPFFDSKKKCGVFFFFWKNGALGEAYFKRDMWFKTKQNITKKKKASNALWRVKVCWGGGEEKFNIHILYIYIMAYKTIYIHIHIYIYKSLYWCVRVPEHVISSLKVQRLGT